MSVFVLIAVTILLYFGIGFMFAFMYQPKGPQDVVFTGDPFYFDNPEWAPKPQE